MYNNFILVQPSKRQESILLPKCPDCTKRFCLERKMGAIFGCGHSLCAECKSKRTDCKVCGKRIPAFTEMQGIYN